MEDGPAAAAGLAEPADLLGGPGRREGVSGTCVTEVPVEWLFGLKLFWSLREFYSQGGGDGVAFFLVAATLGFQDPGRRVGRQWENGFADSFAVTQITKSNDPERPFEVEGDTFVSLVLFSARHRAGTVVGWTTRLTARAARLLDRGQQGVRQPEEQVLRGRQQRRAKV